MLNFKKDSKSYLDLAVSLSDSTIISALIDAGLDFLNEDGGWQDVHISVLKGDADQVKALVQNVLDPQSGKINARTKANYTPLMLAAIMGNESIISILLDIEADIFLLDNN